MFGTGEPKLNRVAFDKDRTFSQRLSSFFGGGSVGGLQEYQASAVEDLADTLKTPGGTGEKEPLLGLGY